MFNMSDGRVESLQTSVAIFGFGEMKDALSHGAMQDLNNEANTQLDDGVHAEQTENLLYRAKVASLGPVAIELLKSNEMRELLQTVFTQQFELSENISCYTNYGPGDHLGAHLDKPAGECAVTIIIYVKTASPDPKAPDTGLVLHVYGEDADSIGKPRMRIATTAGSLVIGRGSRVWHERPRLKSDESVIAITGCYKLAEAAP